MDKKSRTLPFTKMQSVGNDYIYFNCFDRDVFINTASPEELSRLLSARRFGVGSDGIVLILPSRVADAKMRIFNADGSEAKMCGNAIRCVAKYLYDNRMINKTTLRIDTLSGIKKLLLTTQQGLVSSVKADMGQAVLEPKKIPVKLDGESVIARAVNIGGEAYQITCVSMGNLHVVVFNKDISKLNLTEIGPAFEHNPLFPDRVNTEFVEIVNRSQIKMRVWERGSGETFGCGTGACAAAVAAALNGFCDKDTDIKVCLHGGELTVRYTDETVYMTGGAEKVFDGVVTV
jgi:carbamoyl-phosphate synthase large subunit